MAEKKERGPEEHLERFGEKIDRFIQGVRELMSLKQMRQEFSELKRRVNRLKQAEKELDELNAPSHIFGSEMQSIKMKLKLPSKVAEVEQEVSTLKQRVAEYNRARGQIAGITVKPEERALEALLDLSQYTILEKIGSGGFSDIHKAQRKDGSILALKIPKLALYETFVPTDFLREAELWSRLSHPNIVKVYEYGTKPYPWIAIEYMEGGSLRSRLGKLTMEESLEIGMKLAEALFYTHHYGVIHRDIKPENVLFDSENTPKLTDWGLGKLMLEASKSISGFKGTLAYAAPEQLFSSKFGEADWRTDIYQLGAVLYEMLTGKLPFGGELGRILSEEVEPPSRLSSGVPAEMDEIVLKAIAKQKEDRYQDIFLLKEELERALKVRSGGAASAAH